jgi:hypothetical protein
MGLKNLLSKIIIGSSLFASLNSFPLEARAATTNDYLGVTSTNLTIDKDMDLIWLYATQYLIQASSSENGEIDSPNDWVDQGSNVTIEAYPNAHYKFVNFSNVPGGSSTNNPYSFAVDDAYTNITANFVQMSNVFENVRFSSARKEGNDISLTIPETSSSSTYHIYSDTNLLNSPYSWPEKTNAPGTGYDLDFRFPLIKDKEYYRAERSWEE